MLQASEKKQHARPCGLHVFACLPAMRFWYAGYLALPHVSAHAPHDNFPAADMTPRCWYASMLHDGRNYLCTHTLFGYMIHALLLAQAHCNAPASPEQLYVSFTYRTCKDCMLEYW